MSPSRRGPGTAWPDEGENGWSDEAPVVEVLDIPEGTGKSGSASAARRRLEQYQEDRRLQEALKDPFDDSGDD